MENMIDFSQIKSTLSKIKPIAEKFDAKEDNKPFNIILAASDIYYQENYHSDIMATILENKRNPTIKYFIEYINGLSDNKIDENNYSNIEVKREENRIDILIRDLTSNNCIIVENKINNAGDMPRQLPNYYRKCSIENEYVVDKILYYSLDGVKSPQKTTWEDDDFKLNLDDKIVLGAAANGSKNDFINAFLVKCKNNTENEQEKAFYSQYIDLLKYLGRKQMTNQIPMEDFYKEMLNEEQYKSALCVRDMLDKFIKFRRDQIRNRFLNAHSPFINQGPAFDHGVYYETIREISKERIKLDIYSELDKTYIQFWIEDPNIESDLIKTILEEIGEYNKFKQLETNKYVIEFEFPKKEKEMYEYIEKFFSLLDKNKDKINQ